MMLEIIYYFVFLSFCGWFLESAYVSIKTKKIVNRGMLFTPFIPVYGVIGTVIMVINSHVDINLFFWFLIACVFATLTEYIVSLTAEKVFKIHLWNYKERRFNFQGRICLDNSIMFGFIGVALVLFIPLINQIYLFLPSFIWIILFIVIILDFITNFRMMQISKTEFIKELGSREFKFKLHTHHKPVGIRTLFMNRNDIIMKYLRKRIDEEMQKLSKIKH